jgi:hypothetical protein
MAFFSRRKIEPVVHEAIERSAYVAAEADAVASQLLAYSDMQSPKHATEVVVQLLSAPGWTQVQFTGSLHPWSFHNVAFWLLDTPGANNEVVVVSAAGANHPGYRLVLDGEISDSFAGWDDDGVPWTVQVPMNHIVKGDPVPVPAAVTLPSGLTAGSELSILIEDPGHDMNPRNEITTKDRARLPRMNSGKHR